MELNVLDDHSIEVKNCFNPFTFVLGDGSELVVSMGKSEFGIGYRDVNQDYIQWFTAKDGRIEFE